MFLGQLCFQGIKTLPPLWKLLSLLPPLPLLSLVHSQLRPRWLRGRDKWRLHSQVSNPSSPLHTVLPLQSPYKRAAPMARKIKAAQRPHVVPAGRLLQQAQTAGHLFLLGAGTTSSQSHTHPLRSPHSLLLSRSLLSLCSPVTAAPPSWTPVMLPSFPAPAL